MKKLIIILIVALVSVTVLTSCGENNKSTSSTSSQISSWKSYFYDGKDEKEAINGLMSSITPDRFKNELADGGRTVKNVDVISTKYKNYANGSVGEVVLSATTDTNGKKDTTEYKLVSFIRTELQPDGTYRSYLLSYTVLPPDEEITDKKIEEMLDQVINSNEDLKDTVSSSSGSSANKPNSSLSNSSIQSSSQQSSKESSSKVESKPVSSGNQIESSKNNSDTLTDNDESIPEYVIDVD